MPDHSWEYAPRSADTVPYAMAIVKIRDPRSEQVNQSIVHANANKSDRPQIQSAKNKYMFLIFPSFWCRVHIGTETCKRGKKHNEYVLFKHLSLL